MTAGSARPPGLLLVATGDPVIARRLRELARENGLRVSEPSDAEPESAAPGGSPGAAGPGGGQPGAQPDIAVIDLQRADALDLVRAWRVRWPGTLIAGHLGVPDRERWVAAQRAGCDLVANRGALVLRLRGLLARPGRQRGRRFPLFDAADVPGRLGLVFHADSTPVGPLAVYHVAGQLHAVADRCPHAGAALSSGDIGGAIVTCPRHGSQFDVRTGERLRGPADPDIPTYPVVQDGGQVFLLLPE